MTKSRKGSSASSSTPSLAHLPGNQDSLQQLTTLFPHLESNVLAAILASTDNNLNEAVEMVLAQSNDLPTPGASSGPTITSTMASPISPSSSPLPPCPECPVCLNSLKGCRIYQCKQGHSLCHQCKNNPQVCKLLLLIRIYSSHLDKTAMNKVRCCPSCRGKLTGRATNMEHLLASIYGNS